MALDERVDERSGETELRHEAEHALLKGTSRDLRAGRQALQRRFERESAAARQLGEPQTQSFGIEKA